MLASNKILVLAITAIAELRGIDGLLDDEILCHGGYIPALCILHLEAFGEGKGASGLWAVAVVFIFEVEVEVERDEGFGEAFFFGLGAFEGLELLVKAVVAR